MRQMQQKILKITLILGCLLSINLGIWAWLYNWRERKRIRNARNNEELESFMAHLPLVSFNTLLPLTDFNP
jgi:hypothetical protein